MDFRTRCSWMSPERCGITPHWQSYNCPLNEKLWGSCRKIFDDFILQSRNCQGLNQEFNCILWSSYPSLLLSKVSVLGPNSPWICGWSMATMAISKNLNLNPGSNSLPQLFGLLRSVPSIDWPVGNSTPQSIQCTDILCCRIDDVMHKLYTHTKRKNRNFWSNSMNFKEVSRGLWMGKILQHTT